MNLIRLRLNPSLKQRTLCNEELLLREDRPPVSAWLRIKFRFIVECVMVEPLSNILDSYINSSPSDESAINLFQGEWSSFLPGLPPAVCGSSPLFDDSRMHSWIARIHAAIPSSISAPHLFKVLELGPLEGGHTYMLSNQGWDIQAIESNCRAFLKCLITANIYGTKARFMLGSFEEYFSGLVPEVMFDFVCCSGVLYHLKKPTESFRRILKHTKSIGIWSHYGSPELLANMPERFSLDSYYDSVSGTSSTGYKQFYGSALDLPSFCGGGQDYSLWMTSQQIKNILAEYGFNIEVINDRIDPAGPHITIFAYKP